MSSKVSSDLDRLLEELTRIVEGLVTGSYAAAEAKGGVKERPFVTASASFNVGFLDEIATKRKGPKPEPDPLIDVMEDARTVRVVVLLPGVRKKDVSVTPTGDAIRVEVTKGDTVYSKEMKCSSAPTRVTVISETENNSVVELVFRKGTRKR